MLTLLVSSLKRKADETLEVPSTIINGCIEKKAAQGSLSTHML